MATALLGWKKLHIAPAFRTGHLGARASPGRRAASVMAPIAMPTMAMLVTVGSALGHRDHLVPPAYG